MRKGENIFKRKDGRYEGRYIKGRNGTKAIYGYVYGKNYKEVKEKKRLALKKSNDNKKKIKHNNFEYYVKEWLLKEKTLVKSSTYNYYSYNIRKHIMPFFKDYSINEINSNLIYEFIDNNSKELKHSTIRQLIVILKGILKNAGRYVEVKFSKIEDNKTKTFTKDNTEVLETYCTSNINPTTISILITMHTGLRIGEICALRRSSIDLTNEVIYVKETVSRIYIDNSSSKTKLIVDTPKTISSVRQIPINKVLLKYLIIFFNKYNLDNNSFLLTCSNKIPDTRTFYNHYLKILKNCKIERINYHALRHTFASKCSLLGMDTKSLSEILGHSNISTTLSVYIHSNMKYKKKFMNENFINSQSKL